MTGGQWTLGPKDGDLNLATGVTGRAAKLGHRLRIAMTDWSATVSWTGGEPAEVELIVEMASLQVVGGQGGLKALSGPEKMLARSNALRCLDAKKFPELHFGSSGIEKVEDGYRLIGDLRIHGTVREFGLDLRVTDDGDRWQLSCAAAVSQADFGVKPYSMMMGAVKVADEIAVTFDVVKPKAG